MAEEIFGESFAPGAVVGGDGFLAAVVDVEAGMFPGEEAGEFAGADELGFAEGVEERILIRSAISDKAKAAYHAPR